MENADSSAPVKYAGFWRRANAYGFDLIIVQLLTLAPTCLLVPFPTLEQVVQTASLGAWGEAYQNLFLVVSAAYNIYFIASPAGATPGKKYCRIRVVHQNGARLNYLQSAMRHATCAIGTLTGGLAFLTAAFTREKLAPQDMLCQTRVVVVPKQKR